MAASVSDIFCVAQEIASKGIVKNGITSVGDSLYTTTFNAVVALIFAPILAVAITKALKKNHLNLG